MILKQPHHLFLSSFSSSWCSSGDWINPDFPLIQLNTRSRGAVIAKHVSAREKKKPWDRLRRRKILNLLITELCWHRWAEQARLYTRSLEWARSQAWNTKGESRAITGRWWEDQTWIHFIIWTMPLRRLFYKCKRLPLRRSQSLKMCVGFWGPCEGILGGKNQVWNCICMWIHSLMCKDVCVSVCGVDCHLIWQQKDFKSSLFPPKFSRLF